MLKNIQNNARVTARISASVKEILQQAADCLGQP